MEKQATSTAELRLAADLMVVLVVMVEVACPAAPQVTAKAWGLVTRRAVGSAASGKMAEEVYVESDVPAPIPVLLGVPMESVLEVETMGREGPVEREAAVATVAAEATAEATAAATAAEATTAEATTAEARVAAATAAEAQQAEAQQAALGAKAG